MEILKKYEFQPDYRNIVSVATNHWVPRIPLYEHLVGGGAISALIGTNPMERMFSSDMEESRQAFREYWDFWRRAGYDTASMEFCVTEILPGGGALGAHKEGCIKTYEDFEKYPWDEVPELFYQKFEPYIRNFAATCPEDMRGIGGVGNGVFEAVQDIVGYMDLCYIRVDDPELYSALFRKMGEVEAVIWKRFLNEFSDAYCLMRFGDDLGFKTMPLIPSDDIRRLVIPQYRRITDLVHAKGKPFLLHSCGCIFDVFEDLIRDAKIDAKHSNEDAIARFPVWVERYGDKIGNFGGVDTDILCGEDLSAIEEYVLDVLEKVQGHGGIAFGCGNSIPDYVPPEGYFTMIETVRRWRQDHRQ